MTESTEAIIVKIDALKRAVAAQLGQEEQKIDPSTMAISLLALDIIAEFFKSIFEMQRLINEMNERLKIVQQNGF